MMKTMFARSQSDARYSSGGKQMFNERHSREKIENFLKEQEARGISQSGLIKDAWEEYHSLMRNEKILAYRHPKQFFESLKNPERDKKQLKTRLDQSPLSKLFASDVDSKWKEGARIQFESLQASDQTLMKLIFQQNSLQDPQNVLSPDDSDLHLYPEGCDDFAKQSIINLFDTTEKYKSHTACHKKEYIRLVCKEATLKKDFPDKYYESISPLNKKKDNEMMEVDEFDKKVSNRGPLYELIVYYTNGNLETIAKQSLYDYYILSKAEELLLECDPKSEWTYSYPDDIQKAASGIHGSSTQGSVTILQLSNSTKEKLLHSAQREDINMAGTWPGIHPNQIGEDQRGLSGGSFSRNNGTESGKRVLQKQNKFQYNENPSQEPRETTPQNEGPGGRTSLSQRPVGRTPQSQGPGRGSPQTQPQRRGLERQNSNSRNEAFGTIPEPGDITVTRWKEAYSDLHKAWSYQKSQIEELTNRLSSFASKQLTEGNAAFTDLSDKNRPTKIGEKFGLIFDDEWSEVFEELKNGGLDDETVICKLQQMIQYGFRFCQKKAAEQLADLECAMKIPILQPFQMKQSLHVPKGMVKILTSATLKHAKDYRKVTASISTPEVCKVFFKEESDFLRKTFQQCSSGEKLKDYINVCIEQMWLMCVQDPQMSLGFAEPGKPLDKELYKFYEKKGNIVHLTVWPVVYLHEGGPIISKGYVLPK